MRDIDIFSRMQKICYLITWRVSRTSTLPSCLKQSISMGSNDLTWDDIDWWFWHHWWWWKFTLLEPEDGVLELIPLKTTSSNIDTCHNEVSLAGVENRFKKDYKKTNNLWCWIGEIGGKKWTKKILLQKAGKYFGHTRKTSFGKFLQPIFSEIVQSRLSQN